MALVATTQAQCPAIWGTVASDLKSNLFSTCNNDTRAAIRLPFHDCYAGACDGSIILSDECATRAENVQLVDICTTLGDKATEYNVSVADLIQVAGAIAVAQCPPGPTVTVQVGRTDTSTANPTAIPGPNTNATTLIAGFEAKGFTAKELVALVGSHSAARSLAGVPFDTTVDKLDSPTYYGEVLNGTQPASIASDQDLAENNATNAAWIEYRDSQSTWNTDFASAFEKMALLGVDDTGLVDCTSTIFG
ncbi:heme peroxidase [Cryphonectria parasitica EP155]|uniref:Peroxidase n=1 Tax=Cryphonectria parasitica (strain ATCC 38755 / EP155) TaxID=660469 RepID=A0A9P5CM21_CRYP1|nr:heme peroxidase [Cryphonectria parasitica EP155]KAF3762812.1 heme peroxidase [Cryphonectria parasitica EP155]